MAEPDVQKELNAIRQDLANLQADMADLAGVLRDLGARRVEGLRNSVEGELRDSREALRRRLDEMRAGGRKRLGEFEEGVGEHPLSALATAFGIGFILGKILDLGGRR